MSDVHPRSIHAARLEYSLRHGGRDYPLTEQSLIEIIASVHAVARRHNRRREIQLRMDAAAAAASSPSPTGAYANLPGVGGLA